MYLKGHVCTVEFFVTFAGTVVPLQLQKTRTEWVTIMSMVEAPADTFTKDG